MTDSPVQIPPVYNATRILADCFFSTYYDFEIHGAEHIPLQGSIIFAANHVSFFDPPAIGARIPRHINYFARDTLYRGWFGKFLLALGTIPVARESADIRSLKAIFKALKKEGAVAIYPEGTRSEDGSFLPPKPGAGMIACKSRATIIPTRLFGTFEAYGRHHKRPSLGGPINIVYGKPIQSEVIDPGPDHPERYLEASRRIMSHIAELRQPLPTII
ncbi:MAG: 1-acyl-sn-glycerol-3-phosphate acyltransferase [Verrucomicrobia bacterium]|nr:1-acyl-sn-glycerol-3-phosphate acyltransferase [Verrucomicrobiota bacterium]